MLITKAYEQLFEKTSTYSTVLEYNRRLSAFNANIRLHRHLIKVNLNLQWKDIDDAIKIGLIQHLLTRLFKSRRHTQNIELYHNFLKNIDILTPVTKTEPILCSSFERLNSQFFFDQMDVPNLQWGTNSLRRLASYNFHNNTITVSTIFQEATQEMLDYVMYHELLHKHHKFKHGNGRSSYHSPEFKADERKFPECEQLERNISKLVRDNKKPKPIQEKKKANETKKTRRFWF